MITLKIFHYPENVLHMPSVCGYSFQNMIARLYFTAPGVNRPAQDILKPWPSLRGTLNFLEATVTGRLTVHTIRIHVEFVTISSPTIVFTFTAVKLCPSTLVLTKLNALIVNMKHFLSSALLRYPWQVNAKFIFRCAIWCFGTCVHCEMITTSS